MRAVIIGLTPAELGKIGAFLDDHPCGVSAGQINTMALNGGITGRARTIRDHLDALVERGELVTWLAVPSKATGWRTDVRLYAQKLPEGLELAGDRGDGSFVEAGAAGKGGHR